MPSDTLVIYSMNRVGKVVPPDKHILRGISRGFYYGAKIGGLGLKTGNGRSPSLWHEMKERAAWRAVLSWWGLFIVYSAFSPVRARRPVFAGWPASPGAGALGDGAEAGIAAAAMPACFPMR